MYHEAGASTAPKLASLTLHGGVPTCHKSENRVKSFQSIKDAKLQTYAQMHVETN